MCVPQHDGVLSGVAEARWGIVTILVRLSDQNRGLPLIAHTVTDTGRLRDIVFATQNVYAPTEPIRRAAPLAVRIGPHC
jgi:hypothetical protein